jgi:flavin reductase (DIM6/NTAB) family NADH-FMN oxidoreductase RutF
MAELDFAALDARTRYQLMTRVAVPRPIALVSTVSAEGVGNLSPFSFFNIGGANPPSAVFCPVNDREGRLKDTVRNIEETGEYVINVVTPDLGAAMNQASWAYPPEVDELAAVGLTPQPSAKVRPPRVAESPIHLELRLWQVIRHGRGPLASNYVVGEIVHLHVADELLTDGLPDNAKFETLARLGGDWYAHVSPACLFALPRPTGPAPAAAAAPDQGRSSVGSVSSVVR